MGEWALAVAVVVVAFVARDVVLRVTAARSRAADVEALRKECEHDRSMLHVWVEQASVANDRITQLERTRVDPKVVLQATDDIHALKGEVSVLKTTSSLRGPR